MSNLKTKREKQYARVDALYKQLMGRYPVLRQYRTLKVGFKDDLIKAIHNSELFAENSVYIIELFLKRYTRTGNYLKNALKFKTRYDLDGNTVEKISKKDLAYYAKALNDHNSRKAANVKRETEKVAKRRRSCNNNNRPTLSLSRNA